MWFKRDPQYNDLIKLKCVKNYIILNINICTNNGEQIILQLYMQTSFILQ